MICYKVGPETFNNVYLAYYKSFQNKHPVEFICRDDEYDQLDWTREPEETFEQLMLAYAQDLRNRYERIILSWSGGTDSHTVYKVFAKYKIHIDEILIKTSNRIAHQPKAHVDWMKKNHYDSTTIITEYDQYDDFLKGMECPNDEWVWQNKANLFVFGVTTGGETSKYLIEKNHSGKKYVMITAHEKPHLIYKNKTWHTRSTDRDLCLLSGYEEDYICPFYLEPLINLKQCHILKRYMHQFIKTNNIKLKENDEAEQILQWRLDENFYKNYALACGRTSELTQGISFLQKKEYQKQHFFDSSKQKNYKNPDFKLTEDKVLYDFLKGYNKVAFNFVEGIFNLYSESKFMYHLHENKLIAPHQFLNLPHLWSKTYNLGQ